MSEAEYIEREREATALLGLLCHWHKYADKWHVRGPEGLEGTTQVVVRKDGTETRVQLLARIHSADGASVYSFAKSKRS